MSMNVIFRRYCITDSYFAPYYITSMEPGLIIWGQAQPNLILPSINNNGDNDDDDYYDDDDYDDDDENYDDDEKDDQVLLDRPILS